MIRVLAPHLVLVTYVVAVATRLALLVATGPISGSDTSGYRAAADALRASPLTDSGAFLSLPPLFPAFLALMPTVAAAAIAQSLIAALVAPVLGLAARRHFGTFAGWSTALLAALEPSFVFWSTYLLTDNLGLVFIAAAIERTSAGFASSRAGHAFAAGAAGGLAILSRAATLAPVIVLACAHVVTGRSRRVRVVAFTAALAFVIAVPVLRNVAVAGEASMYRDQGWQLIWTGTMWNEVGRGTAGVDITYPPGYDSWSPAQRNEFFQREATTFIREHPLTYAGLMLRKALWYWLPFYPEWSTLHKLWATAYFVALYALALAGIRARRRDPLTGVLIALIVVLTGTVMVTIVDYDGRYRLPAELALVPLAGAGIAWLRDATARRTATAPSTARV